MHILNSSEEEHGHFFYFVGITVRVIHVGEQYGLAYRALFSRCKLTCWDTQHDLGTMKQWHLVCAATDLQEYKLAQIRMGRK
jgi:hypothetical protein